jgi:hypothetical protein
MLKSHNKAAKKMNQNKIQVIEINTLKFRAFLYCLKTMTSGATRKAASRAEEKYVKQQKLMVEAEMTY